MTQDTNKRISLFSKIEKELLNKWKENKTFQKSIDQNKNNKAFVFFDGPPFANGLPHYGHLLTGFVKDIFARYQTMKGRVVERKFGWDCHGLPAEMEVEKTICKSGKKDILEYGIDKFNAECRKSVMTYEKEWEYYVETQGRWVDFENSYKTMDKEYMESVIWAFKELYNKGLVYEDYRVMPYSWKCQTPVSNFETKMDNSYREKQSKSVYLRVKLKKETMTQVLLNQLKKYNIDDKNCYIIIWTTTPWTLPSNLAIAVNKNIDYNVTLHNDDVYIYAESLENKIFSILNKKN